MSRERILMDDGTMVVIGWDPPFNTWFALQYDDYDDSGSPRVAIGYHPAEQALLKAERPSAIIGPYPVEDAEVLVTKLIPELMGLEPLPADKQPMCIYCGLPPWKPGKPDCPDHPYDRLRG
jgi:hypothetical protein